MTEIAPLRRGAANWIQSDRETEVRRGSGWDGRRTSHARLDLDFSHSARVVVSEPLRLAVWEGECLVYKFV